MSRLAPHARTIRDRPSGTGRALSPARVWLILGVAFVVIGTLAPFDFSVAQPALRERLREALELPGWTTLLDGPLHFAGFVALGFALVATARTALRARPLALVLGTAAGFCVLLELAQLLLPQRHARLGDALINAAGLMLGLWAAAHTPRGRRWLATALAFSRRHVRALATGIATVALLAWSSVALQPALGALRLDWDPSFRLLIGNEIYPPRPWLGDLGFVRVYDRALPPEDVARLHAAAADPDAAPAAGLLVGYDFRELAGAPRLAPEGALSHRALHVSVPPSLRRSSDRGVSFTAPDTIASRGEAAPLSAAVERTGAFTVEAWFRPGNLQQGGPARIISLSDGWRKRNFMLGQEGNAVVFRVRNGVNGLSGSPYALQVAGVVEPAWQHVVASYDHGVSVLYKDGRRIGEAVDLLEPAFYFPLGDRQTGWAVIALLLVVTLGMPVALLARTHPASRRHALALGATLAAASVPYALACIVVGGPIRADYFLWILAVVVLGYALLARLATVRRVSMPSPAPGQPASGPCQPVATAEC